MTVTFLDLVDGDEPRAASLALAAVAPDKAGLRVVLQMAGLPSGGDDTEPVSAPAAASAGNPVTVTEKHCPGCCEPGETKPAAEFYRRRASPDGLYSKCKTCAGKAQRDYRAQPGYLAKDRKRKADKRARELQASGPKPDRRRRENRPLRLPEPPRADVHYSILRDLAEQFWKEAESLSMTRTELMNMILAERYLPERMEVVA